MTDRKHGDFLTFDDLVEVAAVAALRRVPLSLQKIRAALDYVRLELEIERPLLHVRFRTDGRDLFLRDGATAPNLTNVTRHGQVAWSLLDNILRDVDYDPTDRRAVAWWPAGRDSQVLIDPRINFGRPVMATLGVRTETLVDRFVAGVALEDLAVEYATSASVVQAAVRFENRSGAIAA